MYIKIVAVLLFFICSNEMLADSAMSILSGRKHHTKHKTHIKNYSKNYSKKHRYRARTNKKRHRRTRRRRHYKKTFWESNFVDPNKYSMHKITNNPYLDIKAIDGPLPQDYAYLFLKSKTLYSPTKTHIKIIIDKSIQKIFVYRDFAHMYTFLSSTGRAGYRTPSGVFKPYSMEEIHYSKKYHNSPMPWSVFFHGGIAIHGTNAVYRLGHTASHGCVRTYTSSARRIYKLIRRYGRKNTTIIVTN